MATELAALDVAIRATGEAGVHGAFRRIDAAGQRTAGRTGKMPLRLIGANRATAQLKTMEVQATRTATATRGITLFGGILATVGITAAFRAFDRMTTATDDLADSQRKLAATAKITGVALDDLNSTAGTGEKEFKLSTVQANNLSIEMAKLAAKAGDIKNATPALRAFLDLGAARGLDAEATLLAVRQAILGIDEGTDKLFNANPSVLYKRYADSIGVAVGKLTDQQKAQAILNAAIEDGAKVQGEYQRRLGTTAGASAQLATETEKAAASFGRAFDPVRRFFLELTTGFVKVIGDSPNVVIALGAVATAIGLVVVAMRAWAAINIANILAGLTALALNPVVLGLAAVGAIVFLITKRFLDARTALVQFRDEVTKLDAETRKLQLVDLAARLAMAETELEAVNKRLASSANTFREGTRGTDLKRQKALRDEINLLRQKIDIMRAIPASEGGTGTQPPPDTTSAEDRAKRMKEEVAILTDLAALQALNRDDIARALEIERILTAELEAGNVTRARRLEIERQLLALREAGLSLSPQEIIDNRPGSGQARPDLATPQVPEFERAEDEIDRMGERLGTALDNLQSTMQSGALAVGMTIADGIAQGIGAGLRGDNPLEVLGNVLLSGFGAIMQQVGAALIEYGVIMTGLLPLLTGPGALFTSGPAAIAAGIALTALGAAFSGAFSGRGGGGGGGRGRGFGGFGTAIPAGSAGFTRDERNSGISRTLPSGVSGPAPTPARAVVNHFTLIGTRDPRVQREIMDIVDGATARRIGSRR